MKQFFKMMFASMTGFILGALLLIFIVIGIIAAAISGLKSDEEVKVKSNSVLKLHMKGYLQERTHDDPFSSFNFNTLTAQHSVGVIDLVRNIQKAKDDAHISGIYIQADPNFYGGFANIEDLRNALIDFKKSGKFIYAYSEFYTERAYYLASVADKVYMNPSGEMLFNGMSTNITFFKGTLDKLGIEMQVFKAGKFKGAVEPFVLTELSPENRHQIDVYLTSLYGTYLSGISATRKIDTAQLADIANRMLVRSAQDAVTYKLVDALKHHDEVMAEIRGKVDAETDKDINFIEPHQYLKVKADKSGEKKEDSENQGKIAILYATGDIVDGEGDMESVGSHAFREAIIKARTNDKIKAVVLRISSPGGSALASEVIRRELELLKKTKPVIVSMGDVAASGGYYIAMASDTIVAEPNTITGSIGVFGLIPNMKKLLNDKLGITIDGVKKGEFADLGRPDRALNPAESAIIQSYVDSVYSQFLNVVANSRPLDKEAVNELAQGRVWTGNDAKERGLVDVIGGIQTALDIAANKAGLTNYRITELPVKKELFEEFIKGMSAETKAKMMQEELGESYVYFMQMRRAVRFQGVQCRMPFEITID